MFAVWPHAVGGSTRSERACGVRTSSISSSGSGRTDPWTTAAGARAGAPAARARPGAAGGGPARDRRGGALEPVGRRAAVVVGEQHDRRAAGAPGRVALAGRAAGTRREAHRPRAERVVGQQPRGLLAGVVEADD